MRWSLPPPRSFRYGPVFGRERYKVAVWNCVWDVETVSFARPPEPLRLAGTAGAMRGRFGRDGTLDVPFASDEDETINPARTKAVYSALENAVPDIAHVFPIRLSTVRNISA